MEPFPQLDGTSGASLGHSLSNGEHKAQRRRKSSGLGMDICAGDTGAPALSTMVEPMSPALLRAKSERDRKAKPFSKRRKAKSMLRRMKNYALRNTWSIPLALLIMIGLGYAVNPSPSNPLHRFIFLSYQLPIPEGSPEGTNHKYGKGAWDFAFVTFYIIFLSFTREFIMQCILYPLALRCGLKSKAKQARFLEQMYTAIYFGFTGPLGLWVMSHTPVWYFNMAGMFEDYPHKTLDADFKFYYLFQGAYWAQQAIVLVLGMEKPRKDFKELVAHHVISISLIWASYRFHFTYMGLPVYITHDISDFFLATSKTLNYIDHPFVGPYFGIFVVVWIYLRHYINIRILLTEFYEFKTVGPYGIVWETEQYKGSLSHWISTALLAGLQGLNLFWLFAILRIAYRFLFANELDDDRSDYEDEEELETEKIEEQVAKDKEDAEIRRIKATAEAPKIELNGNTVRVTDDAETTAVPQKVKVQRRKA